MYPDSAFSLSAAAPTPVMAAGRSWYVSKSQEMLGYFEIWELCLGFFRSSLNLR